MEAAGARGVSVREAGADGEAERSHWEEEGELKGRWGYLRPARPGEGGDYVIEVAELLPESPKPSAPGQATVNVTIKTGQLVTDEMIERGARALHALQNERLRLWNAFLEPWKSWDEMTEAAREAYRADARAYLEAILGVSGGGGDAD